MSATSFDTPRDISHALDTRVLGILNTPRQMSHELASSDLNPQERAEEVMNISTLQEKCQDMSSEFIDKPRIMSTAEELEEFLQEALVLMMFLDADDCR